MVFKKELKKRKSYLKSMEFLILIKGSEVAPYKSTETVVTKMRFKAALLLQIDKWS